MVLAKYNSEWKTVAGGTCYADTPVGTIQAYGGTQLPAGWLLCNGAELLISAYPELYDVIGDAFGTASDTDHFVLPDLRESVPKGTGLTGNSNNHLDADGLALGEFIDDRLQTHTHNFTGPQTRTGNDGTYGSYTTWKGTKTESTQNNTGRSGATTEVKAVGVNYIIKAEKVAIPADFNAHVEEAVSNNVGLNTDSTPQVIMTVGGSATVPNGITSQGQTWTATDNGYVYFEFRLLTLTQVSISLDGVKVHNNCAAAANMTIEGNGEIHSALIRIKKGQTVKLWLAYTGGNKAWLYQANFYKD